MTNTLSVVRADVATEYPHHDPDVCPATPFGPGGDDWPTSTELTHGVGHAGPYFPYDIEDPRAPTREKRGPGFVREDEYIKAGIVKTYKRKPKKKR